MLIRIRFSGGYPPAAKKPCLAEVMDIVVVDIKLSTRKNVMTSRILDDFFLVVMDISMTTKKMS